jgi:hypothetical protein
MPKTQYSAPQVGCLVASCQRLAPKQFPLCASHWSLLPQFILEYLEGCGKTSVSKLSHACEWAANYLDMEEESV